MRIWAILTLLLPALAACGRDQIPERREAYGAPTAGVPTCSNPQRTGTLPTVLREASGVAVSRRHPGILWMHNDSGSKPYLFAVDSTGHSHARIRVNGARNRDWEDIALGPCPTGECLYLADTGDNRLKRTDAAIYRVPEPAPGDTVTGLAERFPIRYPNGPRDVEALYILPDGTIYLISKGRRHPTELFRYPPPLRPGEIVMLEEVQRLYDDARALPFQITGASAAPDGRWIAVRSYGYLQLYRPHPDGSLAPALPAPGLNLDPLAEPQGEGVAVRDDGTIFLTSEAGPDRVPGTIGRLTCRAPTIPPSP